MSVDLRHLRHVPGPHQTCLRKVTYTTWERAEQAALRLMEDAPDGKTPIVANDRDIKGWTTEVVKGPSRGVVMTLTEVQL